MTVKTTPMVDAIRRSPAYLREAAAHARRRAKGCPYEGCAESEKCLEPNHCAEINAPTTKEKRMPKPCSTPEQPEQQVTRRDAWYAAALIMAALLVIELAVGRAASTTVATDAVEAVATALKQVGK